MLGSGKILFYFSIKIFSASFIGNYILSPKKPATYKMSINLCILVYSVLLVCFLPLYQYYTFFINKAL